MNIINRILTFLKEVRLEIKKVNWLSRQQVVNYTLLVIGVIAATAFFFGAVDFGFSELINKYILTK